jgi:hypothetical protein
MGRFTFGVPPIWNRSSYTSARRSGTHIHAIGTTNSSYVRSSAAPVIFTTAEVPILRRPALFSWLLRARFTPTTPAMRGVASVAFTYQRLW